MKKSLHKLKFKILVPIIEKLHLSWLFGDFCINPSKEIFDDEGNYLYTEIINNEGDMTKIRWCKNLWEIQNLNTLIEGVDYVYFPDNNHMNIVRKGFDFSD